MELKEPAPPQHTQSVPATSVWLVSSAKQHPSCSPLTSETTTHIHSSYTSQQWTDIRKTEHRAVTARRDIGIMFWPLPNLVNRKSICCPVRLDTWSNSCENFPNLENEFCYEQAGREDKSKHHQTWSSSNLPIE